MSPGLQLRMLATVLPQLFCCTYSSITAILNVCFTQMIPKVLELNCQGEVMKTWQGEWRGENRYFKDYTQLNIKKVLEGKNTGWNRKTQTRKASVKQSLSNVLIQTCMTVEWAAQNQQINGMTCSGISKRGLTFYSFTTMKTKENIYKQVLSDVSNSKKYLKIVHMYEPRRKSTT